MLASMLTLLLPRRGHYRALVVPHTCRRERTSCAQALKANLLLREYAISFYGSARIALASSAFDCGANYAGTALLMFPLTFFTEHTCMQPHSFFSTEGVTLQRVCPDKQQLIVNACSSACGSLFCSLHVPRFSSFLHLFI